MIILNRDILSAHGPYLEFVALPSMLLYEEGDWPKVSDYKRHSFFSLSNELLEALCQVNRPRPSRSRRPLRKTHQEARSGD